MSLRKPTASPTLSPQNISAEEELKKAMESGNVVVLKHAIERAKAEKVSQEAGRWQCGIGTFAHV